MSEPLVKARAAKLARAGIYAAHVAELAEALRIDVRIDRTRGGRATPSYRYVSIAPVRGIVTYYVALHELGHVVGRGRSAPKLEQEANAWQWAIEHAIVPPSPGVRKMIRRCLRNYHARHVRMAQRRYVRFPPSEHSFWTLAGIEPHTQWAR